MKDLIIKTVDILVLAFVILVTLGFFIGGWASIGFFSGLGLGILGFVFSAMAAGTWIILTRIHDRLKSIDEKTSK